MISALFPTLSETSMTAQTMRGAVAFAASDASDVSDASDASVASVAGASDASVASVAGASAASVASVAAVGVASATSEQLSVDDLDRAITQLAQHMNAETYRMLVLVREFDERFGWAKWGCASCADWLAWRCGLSPGAAREKVRTANALRELPAISAAFAAGKLSYSKVRALTRVAASHDEDLLLAYALEATAAQVEDRCRQIRNTEPDSVHAARHAWERRSLTRFRDRARNCVRIVIELPAEEGELVGHAVDSAVAAGEAALGVEFASERSGESWKAQQADALVAIMKTYLGGGARGAGNGADAEAPRKRSVPAADHYQVVVHVDEKALRGESGRSDLPIETVRRLACDCSLVTIVEDERGTPLDVGRKQRKVPTALRRALWSRDRGCTFPGCRHAHYVDAHHVRHWIDGGDTSLENTTLVCGHHHKLLHEGGFTMHRDDSGGTYFRRPDGRVIPRAGYRAVDMIDACLGIDGAELDRVSAETRMSAIVCGVAYEEIDGADVPAGTWRHESGAENPSAVREARGVYRVVAGRRGTAAVCSMRAGS
jgi:hypothetical protein